MKQILILCTAVLLCSCTHSVKMPVFQLSEPHIDDTGTITFFLANTGTKGISTFTVKGRGWKDETLYPVTAVCSTPVPAGATVQFQIPSETKGLELELLFVSAMIFSDGSIWKDALGVFANYYVTQ